MSELWCEHTERSVLGGLMLLEREQSAVSAEVLGVLPAEAFYRREHREIYKTYGDLYRQNGAADEVTVARTLTACGSSVEQSYVMGLPDAVGSTANIKHHATLVADDWRRRQVCDLIQEVEGPVPEMLSRMMSKLVDISDTGKSRKATPMKELIRRELNRMQASARGEEEKPLLSGFSAVDDVMLGLKPSNLLYIAARPSQGKTCLGLGMALSAALEQKKNVLFFSLEMSEDELTQRAVIWRARVPSERYYSGVSGKSSLTEIDRTKIAKVLGELDTDRLVIVDKAGIKPGQMRAEAMKMQMQQGLDLIVVDYLQLMHPDNHSPSTEQRTSECSMALKELAKDLNVPVIAICQLNRDVEKRSSPEPILSDLRSSGQLEQDADKVLFLWRTDQDNEDGVANLKLAKHRNGPTGLMRLRFTGAYMRFDDLPNPK